MNQNFINRIKNGTEKIQLPKLNTLINKNSNNNNNDEKHE